MLALECLCWELCSCENQLQAASTTYQPGRRQTL